MRAHGWQCFWEIAVLDSAGELCYDTAVTDDVLRQQCDPDVDNILGQISRLWLNELKIGQMSVKYTGKKLYH